MIYIGKIKTYISKFNNRPISKENIFTIFSDHPEMEDRKAIIMHGFMRVDENTQNEIVAEMQKIIKEYHEIERHIDDMSGNI